ncbi:MAG TPA: hypothetical protein VK803_12320 [Steroidobacteraceae bacterium]|nr:hypothetical protein [Steroidobacteraceae bacterium]
MRAMHLGFLWTVLLCLAAARATAQQSAPPPTAPAGAAVPAQDIPRPDQLEPGVATTPAPAQAAPAATPTGARKGAATAPAPKAAQPQAAGGHKGPDRLELDTTDITGNRELPKVLYIVPWKRADLGDLSGRPPNSLLDEVLQPLDRDVFQRENRYYDALKPAQAAPKTDTPQGSATKP